MKIIYLLFLLQIFVLLPLTGCSQKKYDSSVNYITISAEKAKKMIVEDNSVIILDVRSEEEFNEGYIEGAILIPNNELSKKASEILTDKSATILIYCRSGNRSASAARELADAGYTNVYDFGGIIDWEYDIVKN